MQRAFEHLNLRRNPFGSTRPEEAARLAILDLSEQLAFLALPGPRVVQFIGECGRGKSTHMRALHAHFPDAPFLYFHPIDRPRLPKRAEVIFLDETQRIGWFRRQLAWRRYPKIIIATHQDHRAEFMRARIPFHHTELEGLTPARLLEIIERRIEWARRAPERPVPTATMTLVRGLIERYGDDLRACSSLLYELIQQMERAEEIPWPPPPGTRQPEPSKHGAPGGMRYVHTSASSK